MKKILLFIATLLLIISCSTDDNYSVLKNIDKRILEYDVNSTDYNLKYVSSYFDKFDKLIVVNPDSTDYMYNYSQKNDYKIVSDIDNPGIVRQGLDMLDELIFKYYNDEFIQKYFPFKIILSSTILQKNYLGQLVARDKNILGSGFIAYHNIDLHSISEEEIHQKTIEYNLDLFKFIFNIPDLFQIDSDFYKFSQEYYSKRLMSTTLTKSDVQRLGFIAPKLFLELDEINNRIYFPTVGEDLLAWFKYIIETPKDEANLFISQHESLRVKYNIMLKALSDTGVNYKLFKD